MTKFVITTINPSRNELWQVHKAGCKDLANARKHNYDSFTEIESATAKTAAESFIDEELREMGYTPEPQFIRIMPCCK